VDRSWFGTRFFEVDALPIPRFLMITENSLAYLTEHARAGDEISVWSLWPFIRDTPPLAHGKCPAEDGAVPRKGAY